MDDFRQNPEDNRPVFHFTAKKGWINDPNGLVFDGEFYHLYYQFYPDGIHHGPMHWGHARTKDFLRWEDLPIALYPDEKGEIFSGSMVMDRENTSGFGTGGRTPMVAVFTHHLEKDGQVLQTQSLAYSLDGGVSFEKYAGNPVIDEGMRDFRDPKVFWHSKTGKWVMVVIGGRNAMFYASADFKNWTHTGTFTTPNPVPKGIWECPDLMRFDTPDGEKWVLMVSINSGEDGDFGMQYFVGSFHEGVFAAETDPQEILTLDFGYDNYAAVTYNGIPDRTVYVGWMNCWFYAEQTPAAGFRGAMSLPRELTLRKTAKGYRLYQKPVRELDERLKQENAFPGAPSLIKCRVSGYEELLFTNGTDTLKVVLDPERRQVSIDRSGCGHEDLGPLFYGRRTGISPEEALGEVTILLDVTSIELFCAGGGLAGTVQYFTEAPFTELRCSREDTELTFYTVRV